MPRWHYRAKWTKAWTIAFAKLSRSHFQDQDASKMTQRKQLDPDKIYIDVRDPNAPPVCEFHEYMNVAIDYLEVLLGCSKDKNIQELFRRAQTWGRPQLMEDPHPSFDQEINTLMNVLDLRAQENNFQLISITVDFLNGYKIKISNLVHRRWNFDWRVGLPIGATVTIRQKNPPCECQYLVDSLNQLRISPLKRRSQAKGGEVCVHIRANDESETLLCAVIVTWVPGESLNSLIPVVMAQVKERLSTTIESQDITEKATVNAVTQISKEVDTLVLQSNRFIAKNRQGPVIHETPMCKN